MIDVILNRGHFFLGVIQIPAVFRSMSRMLWVWFSYCFEGIHR